MTFDQMSPILALREVSSPAGYANESSVFGELVRTCLPCMPSQACIAHRCTTHGGAFGSGLAYLQSSLTQPLARWYSLGK
jgi:hypothetical protein